MALLALAVVLGRFSVDRSELPDLAANLIDLTPRLGDIDPRRALDGGLFHEGRIGPRGGFFECDHAARTVGREALAGHLVAHSLELSFKARYLGLEIQPPAVGLEECALGLAEVLLDDALLRLLAMENVAVG